MPQVNPDTVESVQTTEEVVKEFITDPTKQYWFFKALQKSLHFDDQSRVQGFGQHILHYRRKCVIKMYDDGKVYEEIAKSLQIPESTVRHDLDWWNENKRKK
jgi:DNA-directed RNA polymerase specialized sigma24 family protein